MKKPGSAADPLWYKDAIIYEIHVRAFADSNNDGIGDFQGLIGKLDYLQDLGVTCLWLLPFFPSPLRDDGYDISNYVAVNPAYGTLEDFQQFLDAAHQRNLQVMIELVINHSSDQHPWFQAARHAPKGSPERAMYVWSDTDKLYDGVRIIFTDTEKSNWTWDEVAQQYYWHRFFSHQPDLNFDNPRVMEEVLNAMRFWMDMGVDGLRLDAIPYLLERDGTSCENVPETHDKIKAIRAAIDAEYSNRLVLAEANMWPEDVRPYFGDGDECHMAFHFPLMPRIYMALRQEDRLPITDIMALTPEIPANCQWGLFLRNHDELTLEMVTDDERDYMYLAYSSDPRMRINVGIRRRLAPLLDNNRRRIELLNSLLLSFPGTPILYYGDEIGMGDNIYLGDRNGVRTPMQWNSDRNAGFSKCDPARLYFPVVMDPIYGYQVINVEAQLSDQSSLLHWTRNMIALRRLFEVFGRGTLKFLHPENRKILAYLRDLERPDGSHETILCVANLSRFAQPVSLDLSEYSGLMPVEMLGYVSFPQIASAAYVLTVAPYSFLWFELQPQAQPVPDTLLTAPEGDPTARELAGSLAAQGWSAFENTPGRELLETALQAWLPRQRWFGAKSRTLARVELLTCTSLPTAKDTAVASSLPETVAIFAVRTHYLEGSSETYQVPLALTAGREVETLQQNNANGIVTILTLPAGPAALHDGMQREEARQALLHLIESQTELQTNSGTLAGERSSLLEAQLHERQGSPQPGRLTAVEQSNTNVIYGQSSILKLFRRLQPGENPDVEIGRFLTEVAGFPRVPPFLGAITATDTGGLKTTTALLQGLVQNEGDGWEWTLEELKRFFESVASCPPPFDPGRRASLSSAGNVSADVMEHARFYLDAAALLGQRTAEMHLALATATDDPAFRAESFTTADLTLDADRIDRQVRTALDALKTKIASLPDLVADEAAYLLSRRIELFAQAHAITALDAAGQRIRIHGDYHLGQTLRSRNDFILLDFEGEPARTLEERRRKQSPLKDVAGMLRSFSYAAWSGLGASARLYPERYATFRQWAQAWEDGVTCRFLEAYGLATGQRAGLLPAPDQADALLNAYQLEKALYELLYELNNRPDWVRIPLSGLQRLLQPAAPMLASGIAAEPR